MIDIEVRGLTELRAKLGRLSGRAYDNVRSYMAYASETLRGMVKANIASRFHSTGPLFGSVRSRVEEQQGHSVSGVVTAGEGLRYARIQEYGGQTRPHDIVAVRAQALAFMTPAKLGFSGGDKESSLVFARRVHHPGSHIPEHAYARPALASFRVPFRDGIRAAVAQAIAE